MSKVKFKLTPRSRNSSRRYEKGARSENKNLKKDKPNKYDNYKEIIVKGVCLDDLDGLEFEKLIGEIYKLHGYNVIDVKFTGDAGRDLILEKDGKRILIECKHHKGTIGRPVIQKLHSAVVVDNKADKGIIITTSRFSKQATNYAKQRNVPIKLIELPILRKLALEVNFKLLLKGEKMEKGFYPVHNSEDTLKNLISCISKKNIISHPLSLEELFTPSDWSVKIIPVYRVNYRIDHTTKTTVGIIYDVHKSGILHLNAKNLKPVSKFEGYFNNTKPIDGPNQPRLAEASRSDVFFDDSARVAGRAVSYLISKYTRTISYYGRNNVQYVKTCVPSSKDIAIYGVTPVYLPIQHTPLLALKRKYDIELVENETNNPKILKSNFSTCHVCGGSIEDHKLICNSCGNLAHEPKWWRRTSDSFQCDSCGKTICRECGYWTSKWLFMKRVLCKECAELEKTKGKNYIRIQNPHNLLRT